MSNGGSQWPAGLDDEAAILRLQTVLIGACEGNQDLNSARDYKQLRAVLIRRADLSDVVPRYIRAHRDLRSLWSYLKGVSPQWQPRREHVWESLKPLFDRIEGRGPPVQSDKWTGRRTAAQQAKVVLAIGPSALQAVEMLLEEQERPLHNQGPIGPEQEAALDKLKELHRALGELIELAEAGRPLGNQLETVKNLKRSAFAWSREQFSLMLAGCELVGNSAVIGLATVYAINILTKGAVDGGPYGALASTIGATGILQAKKLKPKVPSDGE